jgi:hypothetical protein
LQRQHHLVAHSLFRSGWLGPNTSFQPTAYGSG